MRIVYLGTPDFSVKPLVELYNNFGSEIVAVITNKDKPFGRKQVITPCPVKVKALEFGIPVFSYDKIRLEGVEDLKKLAPDLMITCAFGQILSKEILDIPKFGTINVHASLLPKYRGASPIHYAILNGEKTTGVSIMKTDEGIDTGDVLMQESLNIGDNETCGELFDRLSDLGAKMIIPAVKSIKDGSAKFIPQNKNQATYTKIIKKQDALIDFSKTSESVVNQIRAFNPSPVAYTFLNGETYKIYSAEISNGKGEIGKVITSENDVLEIACGSGSIKVNILQKQGGKPLNIKQFNNGNKIPVGSVFTNG